MATVKVKFNVYTKPIYKYLARKERQIARGEKVDLEKVTRHVGKLISANIQVIYG